MFTGLVREVGKVASFEGGRLVIESETPAQLGDSIAVDGVCLTVVANGAGTLAFDVVPETLDRVKPFGERVNLEPALSAAIASRAPSPSAATHSTVPTPSTCPWT